ncbi:hypothetical protein [Brasilonema sp. UFV-L1]|uniref:hypothetical protein n=1 Tax=Brasilonema sp. UFV-L1 TaxID=2234130 RepID=UPI00145CB135|nr:hypothetical protein [Brasilonema sp. UFV-L1]NMG11623.1 hypothetical protein [Brasilonema sp. UFV-L1]
MQIAFTGPRQLTKQQEGNIYKDFSYFISNHKADWHVGDAPGLDNFVRRAAGYYKKQLTVYEVEGTEKWHFVERSKRMIDAIAALSDAWLYAFPNKLCPSECKPCKSPNGGGSGTWLTIAYAKYRGLQIYLFPLFQTQFDDTSCLPDWMKEPEAEQLSLF